MTGAGCGKGCRKCWGGWRQCCRECRLVRDVGTLRLAHLHEHQGTTAPQVWCDRHSARLWLVDHSRLMPGSHQAASAPHCVCASTLCLPVGQVISCNTQWLLLPGWSWLLSHHLKAGAESAWGRLAPAIYSCYFLASPSHPASVFFLCIPKLYQGASVLMGSPEVLLEIIKITTQSTILARVQQIACVSNPFSLY